ncbi:hypothetical protein [Vulgatibacter incomptus]|uniref:Lipoprotein n=1 Tax=Vulgatibacter incomptus TaxID=1391653 RepID=A0A0K1PF42_9BACT|nr:hypothetical protein [Vulgatibacter incomptus]AKU92153.1 hypothetical protein AKJ08_2540 [Vulgatibacter incomptus]
MFPRPLLFALVALLLGSGACATTSAGRSAEQLADASRELYDALQFGDYQFVAQRISSDLRTDFLARAYGLEKSLSVLEYTTISVELQPGGDSARMLTRMSWYELPSTVVKTDNVFIDWKRVGQGSQSGWIIEKISGGPIPVPAD